MTKTKKKTSTTFEMRRAMDKVDKWERDRLAERKNARMEGFVMGFAEVFMTAFAKQLEENFMEKFELRDDIAKQRTAIAMKGMGLSDALVAKATNLPIKKIELL